MKCPNCNLCFNTISIKDESGITKLYKYCEICNSVYSFNRTQLFKIEDQNIINLVKERYKKKFLNVKF